MLGIHAGKDPQVPHPRGDPARPHRGIVGHLKVHDAGDTARRGSPCRIRNERLDTRHIGVFVILQGDLEVEGRGLPQEARRHAEARRGGRVDPHRVKIVAQQHHGGTRASGGK